MMGVAPCLIDAQEMLVTVLECDHGILLRICHDQDQKKDVAALRPHFPKSGKPIYIVAIGVASTAQTGTFMTYTTSVANLLEFSSR